MRKKISVFIFVLFFSAKVCANSWSWPQAIEKSEAKEPPTAALFGTNDDQRLVVIWKSKSTNQLNYTFSNNLLQDGTGAVTWDNPIYELIQFGGDTVQPSTYPTAVVADGKLFVFMIDKDQSKHIKYVVADDLKTLTEPSFWHLGSYRYSGKSYPKGGVTAQVMERQNQSDLIILTMKMLDQVIDGDGTKRDVEKLRMTHLTFDQAGKEEWEEFVTYNNHTQKGANSYFRLQDDGKKYDLHTLRISSDQGILVHTETVDDLNFPSKFDGTRVRNEDDKKFNVKSERLELINSSILGKERTHVFYVNRSDHTIASMWYDPDTKTWKGFEPICHTPSNKAFKTDCGVSVIDANGVLHLFFVDKDKKTLHHTMLDNYT